MRLKFLLLPFLFLIIVSKKLTAGEIKWKGNDGNWSNAANWEGNRLPGLQDMVLIESGVVNILKKTTVQISQIKLTSGAKLNNSGRILITDAPATAIRIENFAVLKNMKKGRIEILKAKETGIYVFNKAMLLNSGRILIGAQVAQRGFRGKQIGRNGLLVANQAIFRNNCVLEINNTKEEAIQNVFESIFANHKKIILGGKNSLLQRHGLKNTAIFTNHKKGKIYIDGTYLDGIRNAEAGMFENSGKIKLGKSKVISSYGIYCQNNSKFRNEKKGKIIAYNLLKEFTKVSKQAKFTDLGKSKNKSKREK